MVGQSRLLFKGSVVSIGSESELPNMVSLGSRGRWAMNRYVQFRRSLERNSLQSIEPEMLVLICFTRLGL